MVAEGPVPTDPIRQQLLLHPHTFVSEPENERLTYFSMHSDAPTAFVRDGEGSALDAPASALGYALPPESLEGRDVAVLQPASYIGTHLGWPHGTNQNPFAFMLQHG